MTTGETAAARAARTDYANDLKGMSDRQIARELADLRNELDELESWIEALTAEQAFRNGAKSPPSSDQIDLVDYLAEHPA